ncbi:MAG TPA: hypothetical protein DCR55_14190 [Lentisphaeria bacterium]|nr:hypothetical protein [Lentisphaeria bacterium]
MRLNHPNTLLIITDQQFADAMSCDIGDRYLHTPHMDSLARSGMRFTRAPSPNPLCVPLRSSVIAGLYPQWTGVQSSGGLCLPACGTRESLFRRCLVPEPTRDLRVFPPPGASVQPDRGASGHAGSAASPAQRCTAGELNRHHGSDAHGLPDPPFVPRRRLHRERLASTALGLLPSY